MRSKRLAGLHVHFAGGRDGDGGGDGLVVVLLHGFGAPGDDLVPLAEALALPPEVRFVFPEAPLSPPELSMFGGRAWWPIDMVALQRAAAAGIPRELQETVPEGMPEAHAQLIALLDALQTELHVSGEQIVLGGFSQGSMLACDVVLRTQRAFGGLILLSSTLLCQREWQPLMAARKGLPVLQSHGTHDPILPYISAQKQRDLLEAAGLPVTWVSFSGGHELPSVVLSAMRTFILARLPRS